MGARAGMAGEGAPEEAAGVHDHVVCLFAAGGRLVSGAEGGAQHGLGVHPVSGAAWVHVLYQGVLSQRERKIASVNLWFLMDEERIPRLLK